MAVAPDDFNTAEAFRERTNRALDVKGEIEFTELYAAFSRCVPRGFNPSPWRSNPSCRRCALLKTSVRVSLVDSEKKFDLVYGGLSDLYRGLSGALGEAPRFNLSQPRSLVSVARPRTCVFLFAPRR